MRYWRRYARFACLAHFGLPEYAPGTIAVNVTWMKRGFNACQTHRSIYPSIVNRLRAIARYWSEIATFSYPLSFNALGRSSWFLVGELPVAKNIPWVGCTHVTDDRQICHAISQKSRLAKNEWSQSAQTWYRESSLETLKVVQFWG